MCRSTEKVSFDLSLERKASIPLRLSAEGIAAQYRQKPDERIRETYGSGDDNSLWRLIHEAMAFRGTEHFEDLLKGSSEGAPRNRINIMDDGQARLTLDEVKKTLNEQKNSKPAGKDEIPVELLKHGN